MIKMILKIIDTEINFILDNIEIYNKEEIERRLKLIKQIIEIGNENDIILPIWNNKEF